MSRLIRCLAVAALSACAMMLLPTAASASFHLMKIREVSPGTGADGSYVELQMYAAGQNFVSGHHITLYDGTTLTKDFPFPGNVTTNTGSQSTILVGDTAAAGTPDFTDMDFVVSPTAGAACFDSIPVDCVSWGTGTTASLQGIAGGPAQALSSGMALRRSITPGCPTLLEAADDTDDSATDFALTSPNPRNNSVAPTESPCNDPPPIDTGTIPIGPAQPVPYTQIQTAQPKKKCKRSKRKSTAYAAKKCKKK